MKAPFISRWRSMRPLSLAVMAGAALLVSAVLLRAAPVTSSAPEAAIEAGSAPVSGAGGQASLFETSLRWVTATVFTAALALALFSFLRRGRPARAVNPPIMVRHQISLGRGTSLALVEMGRSFLLVGVGPESVTRLKELRGDEAEELRAAMPSVSRGAFAAIIAGVASRAGGRS